MTGNSGYNKCMANESYRRIWDFSEPLDDTWEAIPEKGWTFEARPGYARLNNLSETDAPIYLRPCSIYGDCVKMHFAPGAERKGVLFFGFIGGFEFITSEFDFSTGKLRILTHEFHKVQPRFETTVPRAFSTISFCRSRSDLPGLPYEGSCLEIFFDGHSAGRVEHIDFLPESLVTFGLKGPGTFALSSFSIFGPKRPRPEYITVGIWQQSIKKTTAQNVDSLIEGVRQAADAGVQILVTPETSLTGLRPSDNDFWDRDITREQLQRFQKAVASIRNAPYTLVGFPAWIPGHKVEGATANEVAINCHIFVRPDGSPGPMMAKVHSCEHGLWHGRNYNLQRVCGVETAVGVCHDGHYQDVWAVGVMAGARLCLHPAAGGNLSGKIPDILNSFRTLGENLDSFWVRVNAGGGSAIVYPCKNRKHPETILAVARDLTEDSPTWPEYSNLGDLLAFARIRLWDATGSYPMRTLRSGRQRYEAWKKLMPEIIEV